MKKKIAYYMSILLSVLLLIAGYMFVCNGENPFGDGAIHENYIRANVTEISSVSEVPLDDTGEYFDITYTFKAVIKSGERKGAVITATENINGYAPYNPRPVSVGDKVILTNSVTVDGDSWSFAEYVRSDTIIVLAVLFCIALVIFGRLKGLKTLFTLVLTLCAVFLVLVPAILTGKNIYLFTIIICLYITAMTLITVNGITRMTLASAVGCMGGVLISAIITAVADIFLKLTGFTDEHAIYIMLINDGAVNIKSLLFAGILVGSIGAVMDVAVDISAAICEISQKVEKPTFKELFKSGMNISRNVIGTMSNTLILAYVGSSLCSVLLIIYNNSFSMLNLFNKENIVTEILQILVGSFGILSALPFTSLVSAFIFSRKFSKSHATKNNVDEEEKDEYAELLEKIDTDKTE